MYLCIVIEGYTNVLIFFNFETGTFNSFYKYDAQYSKGEINMCYLWNMTIFEKL